MKIAHLDCFAGISGDMMLGALIDAGADEINLRNELGKLQGVQFELRVSKVSKHLIEATDVQVVTKEEGIHRRLKDIETIIGTSRLSEPVKTRSTEIFRLLAEAEAHVHGTTPDDVHFHEVGAADAIVDIVGAAAGIELLGIERLTAGPLPMGTGFVETAHGMIPLPAPATLEILKGVPIFPAGIEGELVTPTGAAIVRKFASEFGNIPPMRLESVGYGAGKSDFQFPNVLRILIGETPKPNSICERVSVLETNIDDMNPELYELAMERIFQAGALDVYMAPIYMKKNRPGVLLSAICPIDKTIEVSRAMLTETTSLGVRIHEANRHCLDRQWETVSTNFGEIRVKIALMDGVVVTASPEYEDCRKAAEAHGIPIRHVYEEAIRQYRRC